MKSQEQKKLEDRIEHLNQIIKSSPVREDYKLLLTYNMAKYFELTGRAYQFRTEPLLVK